ncbi:hypothetical protein QEG98_33990 [Myxococcus sp. MxC21-1]|uniref:phage terminase large subunit family protein n=1 Tax=Myxococcus sp. MxC21-1 TaxID=3041439 RepID=UPI00292FEFE1|nr:hypothetical protein [Myxococcus sp. MxC21-1]WNZ60894.1 hypothetical protein QEG98_33990 [Myxococcus sp. MxC21-1]
MTLSIVKRTEDDLTQWLATESGFISGLCNYDSEPVVLEPYQQSFLGNRSRFRWVAKSRQVGFSFLFALEALARCHLRDGHTAVFVSYNLSDAVEKVLIARQVYEELPLAYQKKLVTDAKTELAFESNSRGRRLSRIISVPAKPPRGKRGDVYLDELAHLVNDREVYTGSTALILRSHGQLTGGSTPLGRRGIFWEIDTQELRKYPHHTRQLVPWWLCRFFSLNVRRPQWRRPSCPPRSASLASDAPSSWSSSTPCPRRTSSRSSNAFYVDESYSFLPYELILPCTTDELPLAQDASDVPVPQGRLVAGFDVGRTRDRSELAVFEEVEGRFTCRMLRSFEGVPFAEQEAHLRRLLSVLPVARLSVDRSGIGMNLAENLARDFPQVVEENFTNEAKERWATDFKILLQRRDVTLPRQRELVGQIHSIKRRVLPSGKVSFDAERTNRGHADKFWAVALACQRERGPERRGTGEIGVRVIG